MVTKKLKKLTFSREEDANRSLLNAYKTVHAIDCFFLKKDAGLSEDDIESVMWGKLQQESKKTLKEIKSLELTMANLLLAIIDMVKKKPAEGEK